MHCAWKRLTLRHSNVGETPFDVVKRVLETVQLNTPYYSQLLLQGTFLPAGRTLKTACPERGVMPNCTVLEPDLALAKRVIRHTTGVGFNLNEERDPVSTMKRLGELPEADATGRKPGIMITLDWKHARIIDFIRCKQTIEQEHPLQNMNISLLVRRDEYQAFAGSDVFVEATRLAHACGDPGILLKRCDETANATSPCGELWLHPNEVCNLGNINVSHFLIGKKWLAKEFEACVLNCLVFLDAVRSRFIYFNDEMRRVSERQARLGLGVMGFADLLKRANASYGSDESVDWVHKIGLSMWNAAQQYKEKTGLQRRLLTLAPTGGTSLITKSSFSIEPFFDECHLIDPLDHVRMQGAWQTYIDNGVSKTVNLSKECSVEQVGQIFNAAFEFNCKGITVYRNGCKTSQPIKIK